MDGNHPPFIAEGREKGFIAERLYFEAFHNYPLALPSWLFKVEKATTEEDRNGIDAWAYTRMGCVAIQLKSSAKGAREYRERHPECKKVMTLIISCSMNPEEIRRITIEQLKNHFTHLRKMRRTRRTGRI